MKVSISINNLDIRVVASEGNSIKDWFTLPLEYGWVKEGHVLHPSVVAKLIDGLFKKHSLTRNDIVIGLNASSITYRTLSLPRIKSKLVRETVERAVRKEINLPLESLYIDWQILEMSETFFRVFVSAASRAIVDSIVETMKLARINVSIIDVNSLAMARIAGQNEALILGFEPENYDIVIVSNGLPVVLHSVVPKIKSDTYEDNVQQLLDEFNRTVDFYNLTHNDSPIKPETPLILIGKYSVESEVSALIQVTTGHQVQSVISSMNIPDSFSLPDYAVNLGLLQRASKPDNKKQEYRDIRLNILNAYKLARKKPLRLSSILIPAYSILAILIIIIFGMVRSQAVSEASDLQKELAIVTTSFETQQIAVAKALEMEKTISGLKADTALLLKEKEIVSGRSDIASSIKYLIDNIPADTEIIDISLNKKGFVIKANTPEKVNVLNYAKNVEKSGKFSVVRIANIEDMITGSVEAEIIFEIYFNW